MAEEQKENRIIECIADIQERALIIRDKLDKSSPTNFLELPPTQWVLEIMKALRLCALSITNYKEFREGLIQSAALCVVVMEYSDHLFREYLSKPAIIKPKLTDEERIMKFPGNHLPPPNNH